MRKTTILTLTIVIIFLLNSIPVLSQDIQGQEQMDTRFQTLETMLYPKQEKMKHIPFEPQQKPDFLTLTQSTINSPPSMVIPIVYSGFLMDSSRSRIRLI
jgi:hypothetical protein